MSAAPLKPVPVVVAEVVAGREVLLTEPVLARAVVLLPAATTTGTEETTLAEVTTTGTEEATLVEESETTTTGEEIVVGAETMTALVEVTLDATVTSAPTMEPPTVEAADTLVARAMGAAKIEKRIVYS